MKLHAFPRILTVAGVCAAALIGLVVSESLARNSGQEVTLPMAAVDPRALLMGHYVIVDLRDRLDANEPCPAHEPDWDWLALAPNGQTYALAGSAPSREDAQQIASVTVKGSFTCSPAFTSPDGPSQPGFVSLDLGINRFYVNQADAQRIERVLREQRPNQDTHVFAIVSVGRDGRARLKGLEVDGARLESNWL